MRILTWNIRGLGDKTKRMAIKRFLKKLNPYIVLLQESKKDGFDRSFIKSIWSSKEIGWASVEANGRSGGILSLWDEGKISVLEVIKR